jgi:Fic-DOC domain mobile mystery protein B
VPVFEYTSGATPLDPGELEGLRLPHITTRAELDRWEEENILAAEDWVWTARGRDPFSEAFILTLHKRMFGSVWKWTGTFRASDKNLGVAPWEIGAKIRILCDDAKTWIATGAYDPDEAAARLHHRLVSIHPFANGNGRHARLWTDYVLVKILDRPRFTWGGASLAEAGTARERYLEALRAADARDYAPLIEFVRS